jgi:hypothetical protein
VTASSSEKLVNLYKQHDTTPQKPANSRNNPVVYTSSSATAVTATAEATFVCHPYSHCSGGAPYVIRRGCIFLLHCEVGGLFIAGYIRTIYNPHFATKKKINPPFQHATATFSTCQPNVLYISVL